MMYIKRLSLLALLLLSLSALLLFRSGPGHPPVFPCVVTFPDALDRTQPVLVICPHPDDEYEGWAAIGHDEIPVFLVLTQGEKTGFCKDLAVSDCKAKRILSEMFFLQRMVSAPYGLLVMDLGDKRLSRGSIEPAIRQVVASIRPKRIVVAAYYNAEPGCTLYTHQDHKAVYDTMREGRWGVPVHLRVASCFRSNKQTLYIDEKEHAKAWGPGGVGQTAYGWLHSGLWPAGESDRDRISFFTRRQDFLVIEPSPPAKGP